MDMVEPTQLIWMDGSLIPRDEALLLDHEGNVAEGAVENFFIVKDEVIITPKLGNILPGITRDSIVRIARDLQFVVRETTVSLEDVYNADEAFLTGTATETMPIASIDHKQFLSYRPITNKIMDAFTDVVTAKNEQYIEWLTFVD